MLLKKKTYFYVAIMVRQTSFGLAISVEVDYLKESSSPRDKVYTFVYHIKIENKNLFSIKLIRRHWTVKDSNGAKREIEDAGVGDSQPVIKPEKSFNYSSEIKLSTGIGKMTGAFVIENRTSKEIFRVPAPEIRFVAPHKLN